MTHDVEDFVNVASSYCSLIEGHEKYSVEDFVARQRLILPQLYNQALRLPDLETGDREPEDEISHERWSNLFEGLRRKLGTIDLYWIIYDPIKNVPDDPVAGSLADDLADIWRDLKDGLLQWPDCSNADRHEVFWRWQFSFHYHWSDHLVNALRIINWLTEHYELLDGDRL